MGGNRYDLMSKPARQVSIDLNLIVFVSKLEGWVKCPRFALKLTQAVVNVMLDQQLTCCDRSDVIGNLFHEFNTSLNLKCDKESPNLMHSSAHHHITVISRIRQS